MRQQNRRCLLLNADFSPLSIICWQKAVMWHMRHEHNPKYGIDIVDFYKNDHINGVNNKKYPIPAVARTKRFFSYQNNTLVFSRKNIFIRDNYHCQYCHQAFNHNELTYDHVIPKSLWDYSQGSPTRWTNITTACINCNRKKGNRTPKQANMPLMNIPIKPGKTFKYLTVSYQLSNINDMPDEWKIYLPSYYA